LYLSFLRSLDHDTGMMKPQITADRLIFASRRTQQMIPSLSDTKSAVENGRVGHWAYVKLRSAHPREGSETCLEEPEARCSHMAVSEAPCRNDMRATNLQAKPSTVSGTIRMSERWQRIRGMQGLQRVRVPDPRERPYSSSHSATRSQRDAQKLAIILVIS
jgi:hypothetical protein